MEPRGIHPLRVEHVSVAGDAFAMPKLNATATCVLNAQRRNARVVKEYPPVGVVFAETKRLGIFAPDVRGIDHHPAINPLAVRAADVARDVHIRRADGQTATGAFHLHLRREAVMECTPLV